MSGGKRFPLRIRIYFFFFFFFAIVLFHSFTVEDVIPSIRIQI